METYCAICTGEADRIFRRTEAWSNERWRLTASTYRDVRGFCYLEPRRHIRNITELDGKEAEEFGSVISKVTSALKKATSSELVYVYIYGDHIPHLHIHLAPHLAGDNYQDDVVKNPEEMSEEVLNEEESENLISQLRREILEKISD